MTKNPAESMANNRIKQRNGTPLETWSRRFNNLTLEIRQYVLSPTQGTQKNNRIARTRESEFACPKPAINRVHTQTHHCHTTRSEPPDLADLKINHTPSSHPQQFKSYGSNDDTRFPFLINFQGDPINNSANPDLDITRVLKQGISFQLNPMIVLNNFITFIIK